MVDWRTLVLGGVAFSATFAGGMWFGVGSLPSLIGLSAASVAPVADARRPQTVGHAMPTVARPNLVSASAQVATVVPTEGVIPPVPAQGPGLTHDDRLRRSVILRAKAYLKPTCNSDPKRLYVAAATRYAATLMRAAGCGTSPRCGIGFGLLDDVWRRNRSLQDLQVAAAMAAVNAAGGLTDKSFRGTVGRAVRVIAGRDFAATRGPACQTARRTRRTFRFRFRRR